MPLIVHPISGQYTWCKTEEEAERLRNLTRKPSFTGPMPHLRVPKPKSWRVEMPDGRRLSIPQVAKETGVPETTVRARFKKGEHVEDIIRPPGTPKQHRG